MGNSKRKYPFDALWLSHTSIVNFEKCPRLYYLYNVYKDPVTRRRIQIVNPYLTLGMAVHDTIDAISTLKSSERFRTPLLEIFETVWSTRGGEIGGFVSPEEEAEFKKRGTDMIKRITQHPGPLARLALKIRDKEEVVAAMWLSEAENIVLCGNVDWAEYLPDKSLHIIDFKTGRHEEEDGSLQLGIYVLLAENKKHLPVSKLSYWYLDHDTEPVIQELPDLTNVKEELLTVGKKMKEVRSKNPTDIVCPSGGCRYCLEYESVIRKQAQHVGYDSRMGRELYIVNQFSL